MRFAKIAVATASVLAFSAALPAAAQDAPKPIIPDTREHGIVTRVLDGDTVWVKLSTGKMRQVRFMSIQAMEHGECHDPEATKRVEDMILGKEIRLESFSTSIKSRGRLYRYLSYKAEDGVWRDVSAQLVADGLVLPMLNPNEWTYNWYYMAFSQRAAERGIGMFNTTNCGVGPDQDIPLELSVKWDAEGNDKRNGNTEHIKITNNGDKKINLSGWWVRDSGLQGPKGHSFTFPKNTTIKPGESILVHPDKGRRTKTDFYMGDHGPIFENVLTGKIFMGDGGYLFDPDGDLRAWQQYPVINVGDAAPDGETDPTNPDGTVNPLTGLPYSFTDLPSGEILVSDGVTTLRLPSDSLI